MSDPTPDVAVKVHEFAGLIAAGRPVAATNAMLTWIGYDNETRTRLFATTAATLVATRVRATMTPRPDGLWLLNPTSTRQRHDVAMCQVVVRIANGEPDVADDMLIAHEAVHGTGGLFWLGVHAVRKLADLLITPKEVRP